jgi:hypothetical protein
VYDWLDQATQDVLKEIQFALRSQRIRPKLGKLNLELDAALTQAPLFAPGDTPSPEENDQLMALRSKVQSVPQNVSLEAFRRDKKLKAIREAYTETQNQRQLIEDLDVFFIENELYRDTVEPKSPLEEIQAEDLQLIAYEVFS